MSNPEGPYFSETIDEYKSVLADESFFIPVDALPEDHEELKSHIQTLYIHLIKTGASIDRLPATVSRPQGKPLFGADRPKPPLLALMIGRL